jgi:hypothetical protein
VSDLDELMFLDDSDWYDDDEDGYRASPKCRDCGSDDVYWAKDRTGKWVLYNTNSRRHTCDKNVLSASRASAFDQLD